MELITKTRFLHFMRCPRLAWLEAHAPETVKDEGSTQSVTGTEVGELARSYFGKRYTVIEKSTPLAMATATTAALKNATKYAVCEASFKSKDLFCSSDIVLVNDDGTLDVYEVKSTSSVKDEHILDTAFQMYVIQKSGWNIRNFYVMHIDTDYVFNGNLDLKKLFKLKDVTREISTLQDKVKEFVSRCRENLAEQDRPFCDLSVNCDKPYKCECRDFCFKLNNVPDNSVFNIAGFTAAKKYELYRQGIVTPEQLLRTSYLNDGQRLQASGMKAASNITVNKDAIKRFLDTLRFPLYLLDFETMQLAIPEFVGTSPYEQVPFQYSLHIMKDFNEVTTEHREFLADERKDDRKALAKQLCEDIPEGEMSMAYNMKFERMVIRKLANDFPAYTHELLSIREAMTDLMVPFQKRYYYNPCQQGSFSIKAVLPAIVGENDPELDYHKLPVVHNGMEAMSTYAAMRKMTDREEVQRIRDGLLKYCHLDTLAMVKVINALYALAYSA